MFQETPAKPGIVVYSVILALGGRSRKHHKFRASLVYTVSSRPAKIPDYLRTSKAGAQSSLVWHAVGDRTCWCRCDDDDDDRERGLLGKQEPGHKALIWGELCIVLQMRQEPGRSLHHAGANAVCSISG